MGTPLRGELTRVAVASSGPAMQERLEGSVDTIQSVLSQFMRLTRPPSSVPSITFTPDPVDAESTRAAAPWTHTAAEVALTEVVLYPFLMHLAAARDDLECLEFCVGSVETNASSVDNAIQATATEAVGHRGVLAGGVVNALEPGSGRSPLHIAALNGHDRSVNFLLKSGALVHLRDTTGHTALYYVSLKQLFPSLPRLSFVGQAARQGHASTVDVLLQVGASLGGVDGRFATMLAQESLDKNDLEGTGIWKKCGIDLKSTAQASGATVDERVA